MDQSVLNAIPVAAVVSAIVTLGIRWLDKPRPVFSFETQLTEKRYIPESDALIIATIAVTNAGDGTAFDVELVGDFSDVAVELGRLAPEHSGRWASRIPKISAGETVLVRTATLTKDKDLAKLVMSWDASPGRPFPALRRRRREISLSSIDSAMPFPVGMVEPRGLPRRFRRWRNLARHTERGQMTSARYREEQVAAANLSDA